MWSFHWHQWNWMWTYVWLGDLIVGPSYEAGGYFENHPFTAESAAEDQMKEKCCLLSTNCQKYYKVRPIKTCDGFTPTKLSRHIT